MTITISEPLTGQLGLTSFISPPITSSAKLPTILAATERVLSQNPDIRSLDKREEVVRLVRLCRSNTSYESITRACRHIQNTKGMYKPEKDDKRIEQEEEYRGYYAPQTQNII